MSLLIAALSVAGVVIVSVALGALWRARTGRLRSEDRELAHIVAEAHRDLGSEATLLQFSTEYCAPCRATHRQLSALADQRAGVSHLEVDLTDRPDLARRLNILQTPTTFVLDPSGRSRVRIGGAPRIAELVATLDRLREDAHAHVA